MGTVGLGTYSLVFSILTLYMLGECPIYVMDFVIQSTVVDRSTPTRAPSTLFVIKSLFYGRNMDERTVRKHLDKLAS